ncbi:MAG: ADP-ribosylglycohydrolase family protein [Gemmatimonadales bacterium]|nr:ADP-ribosylglycohydrolase family protein [Gemmatimonadales bacterium]
MHRPVPTPPLPADRWLGALLAHALGDAVGAGVEGAPRAEAERYAAALRASGADALRPHHGRPAGHVSDDTQCTRLLLESLAAEGQVVPARVASGLATLVACGAYVGGGEGTLGVARRLAQGVPWTDAAAPPGYEANGAAMRAAPIGLWLAGDERALLAAADAQAAITHRSPVARGGAQVVALAVARAAATCGRPWTDAPGFVHALADGVAEAAPPWAAWLTRLAEAAAQGDACAAIAPCAPAGDGSSRRHGVSGHAVPSVIAALAVAITHMDDPWEAILAAIALGGDTDSVAAMAGAVTGARAASAAPLPGSLLSRLHEHGAWDQVDGYAATIRRAAERVGAGA